MASKYKYYKFTYTGNERQPSLCSVYRIRGRGTRVSYYSFREGKWTESIIPTEKALLVEASTDYEIKILHESEIEAELSMLELVS